MSILMSMVAMFAFPVALALGMDRFSGRRMTGLLLVGVIITAPVALGSGQWIDPFAATWGVAEFSLVASSVIHGLVYALYVWMVGRAGAVFSSQVSYLVTGFGVFWAMLLLGEGYLPYIWAALGMILFGLFLVQPKANNTTPDGLA